MGEYLVGRAIQNQGKGAQVNQDRNQRMQRTVGDLKRRGDDNPGLQPANIGIAIREELEQVARAHRSLRIQSALSVLMTLVVNVPLSAVITQTNYGDTREATLVLGAFACIASMTIPVTFTAGASVRTAGFVRRLQHQTGLAEKAGPWLRLNKLNLAVSFLPLVVLAVVLCL